MRQSRAPTASQIQNPPPPPSTTKSTRLFGSTNLGECGSDLDFLCRRFRLSLYLCVWVWPRTRPVECPSAFLGPASLKSRRLGEVEGMPVVFTHVYSEPRAIK